MERTSIRLAPEVTKKLHAEARKLTEETGEIVTVSDLISACIGEKFPQVCARIRSEHAAFSELRDEVVVLRESNVQLGGDTQNLVKTLSQILPLLATREQVDSLTDAIAAVIKAIKER